MKKVIFFFEFVTCRWVKGIKLGTGSVLMLVRKTENSCLESITSLTESTAHSYPHNKVNKRFNHNIKSGLLVSGLVGEEDDAVL